MVTDHASPLSQEWFHKRRATLKKTDPDSVSPPPPSAHVSKSAKEPTNEADRSELDVLYQEEALYQENWPPYEGRSALSKKIGWEMKRIRNWLRKRRVRDVLTSQAAAKESVSNTWPGIALTVELVY